MNEVVFGDYGLYGKGHLCAMYRLLVCAGGCTSREQGSVHKRGPREETPAQHGAGTAWQHKVPCAHPLTTFEVHDHAVCHTLAYIYNHKFLQNAARVSYCVLLCKVRLSVRICFDIHVVKCSMVHYVALRQPPCTLQGMQGDGQGRN